MKVWQTNADYFFGNAARVSLSKKAGSLSCCDDLVQSASSYPEFGDGLGTAGVGGTGGGSGGGASSALVYLGCSLLGSLLGAGIVGWSLQRSNSRRWSRMYRTINGSDAIGSS